MATATVRAHYFTTALIGAICYFAGTLIIFELTGRDPAATAAWNAALIILLLVWDRFEDFLFTKVRLRGYRQGASRLVRYFQAYHHQASNKSSFYLYYVGVLVGTGITAVAPETPILRDLTDYFVAVRYGLLVLLALDRFLEKLFRDIDRSSLAHLHRRIGLLEPTIDPALIGQGVTINTPTGRERRYLGDLDGFNEIDVLNRAGRQGWHSIDYSAESHLVERDVQQWEHTRTRFNRTPQGAGWQRVGDGWGWMTYWARPLAIPAQPPEPTSLQPPEPTSLQPPTAQRSVAGGRFG